MIHKRCIGSGNPLHPEPARCSIFAMVNDWRLGLRVLARNPGFACIAVAALALGIGANSAIFSVVNAVLLRPLEYPDPGRIAIVWDTNPHINLGITLLPPTIPNFLDWKAENRSFERMASVTSENVNLTGMGDPERFTAARVSADFFPIMGIAPMLGRTFRPEQDREGAGCAAVLGFGLWRRRFGSDPSAVGRSVRLNGQSCVIEGVMPKGFEFPKSAEMPTYFGFGEKTEVWIPSAYSARQLRNRGSHTIFVIARLRRATPLARADAEMKGIAARLEQKYPNDNSGWSAGVQPLQQHIVSGVRPALLVMQAAVAFVLLIACANVANLLLARAAGRHKEMAIRTAIGAGPRQLARQLLVESLILALLGGAFGLLLSIWGVKAFASLAPSNIPRVRDASLDFTVLAFTLAISLATGILFGLVPAVQAVRADVNATLKEGGKSSAARGSRRLRSVLVLGEVTTATLLLAGAGLLIRSFLKLENVDPGFRPEKILAMDIPLPDSEMYRGPGKKAAFFEQLLQRYTALPGVAGAGAISALPLAGGEEVELVTVEGRPAPKSVSEAALGDLRVVTPGYFAVMGIPALKGRVNSERDTRDSVQIAVVDQVMASTYWPGADPVGRRFKLGDQNSKAPWLTVVGVVGSVRHSGLHAVMRPQFFLPHRQFDWSSMTVVLRTAADPTSVVPVLKKEVRAVDPDQPIAKIMTVESVLADSVALPRFRTLLLGVFAALALLLAAVGIYGVVSYTVSQRTREIGLRVALGAARGTILRMVFRQGISLALGGVCCGLAAAFGLTRLLSGMLYGVGATDPATFAEVSVVLIVVAAAASYLPARRALRVDPVVALREE